MNRRRPDGPSLPGQIAAWVVIVAVLYVGGCALLTWDVWPPHLAFAP
jgi:hypothetical protein